MTGIWPCFFRHIQPTLHFPPGKKFKYSFRAFFLSCKGFQILATLARCRLLHSRRWHPLSRRTDDPCRFSGIFTSLATPARPESSKSCNSFPSWLRLGQLFRYQISFLPYAALRRSWEFHIHMLYSFWLFGSCIKSFIRSLLLPGFILKGSDFAVETYLEFGFKLSPLPVQFYNLHPYHLSMYLYFSSLRSIRSGCNMPFDFFMHSNFRFCLHNFLLRVNCFNFTGIATVLLLRSSAASPGLVTMISSGELKLQFSAPFSQVFLKNSVHNRLTQVMNNC